VELKEGTGVPARQQAAHVEELFNLQHQLIANETSGKRLKSARKWENLALMLKESDCCRRAGGPQAERGTEDLEERDLMETLPANERVLRLPLREPGWSAVGRNYRGKKKP